MWKQYEVLVCPFCHEGTISCIYFPGAWSEKRKGRNSLGSGKSVTKSSAVWVVQSGCAKCNRGKEEVETELRKQGFFR